MQVHVYLDESGDHLVVEIPTGDGTFRAVFDHDKLNDSHIDNPLVGQMPEPTGSTVYSKPIGEMPLKVQEEYSRRVQEENAARASAAQDVLGSEGAREPNADPNPQLGAIDPTVLDPDGGTGQDAATGKSGNKSTAGKK